VPDLFDDGEVSVEDFALPGDEEYRPQVDEAPVAVADEPAPAEAADTAGEDVTSVEPDQLSVAVADPAEAEVADEPPRDPETGRFLPRNIEVDDPDVAAYLDKYQGDPVKALRAATEAQRKIGEMGNELGQYRQWYEQQAQQTQQQTGNVDVATLQDQLYENQHAIIPTIQSAHQRALLGDTQAALVRDTAIATLRDLNAVEAERYSRWVAQSEWQQQQQTQQAVQTNQQSAWNQTVAQLEQELPRINELAPTIMEIAQQPQFGAALEVLQSGNPDARAWAIRTLYREAEAQKGRQNADTLSQTAAQIAKDTAVEAERAIAEASVASATTSVPTRELTPREKDLAETFAEWDADDAKYSRGWNIS
jgi:hypothetical protein